MAAPGNENVSSMAMYTLAAKEIITYSPNAAIPAVISRDLQRMSSDHMNKSFDMTLKCHKVTDLLRWKHFAHQHPQKNVDSKAAEKCQCKKCVQHEIAVAARKIQIAVVACRVSSNWQIQIPINAYQ